MSNFTFIPAPWAALAEAPQEAEQQVHAAPLYAAMLCRKSLEEWVRWMYEHDPDLALPYDTTLSSLMHEQAFKNLVAPNQFHQINLVRKLGNTAVHTAARIKPQEALYALQLLHGFIGWVVQLYSEEKVTVPKFDESLLSRQKGRDRHKDELQQLEKNYHEAQSKLQKLEAELAAIQAVKAQNVAWVAPPIDPNEALTRKIYIDTLLREAGWDPYGPQVPEYPVQGMPQGNGDANGRGFVDYVLWADDGLPLAVVEAKRTKKDPRIGQHQAKLYADCLQAAFGQRPVIFYTNGFRTWLWDDLRYAPREVFGFYTKDELQLLIQRRSAQKTLATQTINNAITDRPYQHEAIRRVSEALDHHHREALLIMATGTGKTRVSASLIDLLSKANWAKRVLFLADRNALIHQAKTNFNDYLPHLPAVDLTREKEDESSRIVFSTYQTIINMIDGEADGQNRFYSVGHFDVIIFDEIHRSVYKRYRHIFNYFDGIRIGLTATPKSETDRDTYALFGMEPHNPTFAYELAQAVSDGFLVPPRAISVPIKFQRKGIKYAELSEAEKQAYEEQFTDPVTGEFPDEIDAAALNKWLFNTDTVDKVIGHLMQHGIKVEGGDKLAKTIVFARSHRHARFIEERFNKQYPAYGGHFLKVIDYQEAYRFDLLNRFKDKPKLPQIAVSVDMLDTGIDVPEVCNLVFFKPVRSSAKFWQMVGRGTRLCRDLFAPGEHKKEFIIFDFCENFEFFDAHPQGTDGSSAKSLSQRLFELRLRLAYLLLAQEDDDDLKAHGQSVLDQLIRQTQALNGESFIVRQHWEAVEKYRDPNAWNALSDLDLRELHTHIAPLIAEADQDELAKRFDALMLDLQLSVLNGEKKQASLIEKVMATAGRLSKKAAIPAVAQKMPTLQQVQQKLFWEGATIPGIERIRIELRGLIQFLDAENTPIYFTVFQDEFVGQATERPLVYSTDLETYRRKVEQYLQEQRNHITISKLRNNIPITQAELDTLDTMLFEQGSLGSKADFTQAYGQQPLGKFIRNILGLDAQAAKRAFAEILEHQTLNAQQIRFMDQIINFLTVKGVIEPAMLFEAPFTDINAHGVAGLFETPTASKIISLIENLNHNAEVA